jgi:RNA polymerase sigma-70 factor, ECF subfamily
MGEVARLRRTWQAAEAAMPSPHTFESFFEDEKDRLLRVLALITGSRTEAEDIAQDAFTRIYERWDSVRAMENPSAYLYRSAMNGFRSEYRRAARTMKRAVGLGPPQDVFQAVEDRDLAVHVLARLTPRQRAALVLTEALGYSGEEAGALLGIKASTVWALTHQARSALKGMQEETLDA